MCNWSPGTATNVHESGLKTLENYQGALELDVI